MKTIILSILLSTASFSLFSQGFEVPKNYKFEKAEDYAPYEQDVIKCIDWLMKSPANEAPSKRKEANAFLLVWLIGSPNVHIDINQEIATFTGGNPALLMIFMGGWAKYSLETKAFDDKIGGSKAGIESVMAFYQSNQKVIAKDKNVEKYIKMKEKGTLDAYIEKNA
jgi:hypothetical protein